MKKPAPAPITFNELGLPVSIEFDDIYFSNDDGLAETRYVFLKHNDLTQRWQTHRHENFVIAESGFGTGLNFLACSQLFLQQAPKSLRLHFVSFEKYPLELEDLQTSWQHFPELAALAEALKNVYPAAEAGCHRVYLAQGRITLDLWFGDIHSQLPAWLPAANNTVDAWFLDGFAPDKNPDMWQPSLYQAMAASCRNQATFATFTAAGAVRRGLQAAGFEVSKAKGYGRKREMLHGQINKAELPTTAKSLTIVGGGIAAACLAWSCSRRGIPVRLLTTGLSDGASGNAQGAVYPLLQAQLSPVSQFFASAFNHARQFYAQTLAEHWHESGVVQLVFTAKRLQRMQKILGQFDANDALYHPLTVHGLTAKETQQLWSALPPHPALFYPRGGWLEPVQAVQQICAAAGDLLKVETISPVTQVKQNGSGWRIFTETGDYDAETLVLAAGAGLTKLLEPWQLPLQNVRGQVTQVASTAVTESCPTVVCYKGYFTPAAQQQHCVGATYSRTYSNAEARQPTVTDDQENLAILQDNLAQPWTENLQITGQRASERNTTRDHLPIVGWLEPGLGVLGGLASRGYTSAPLCAELLVAQWCQEPAPLAADLIKRLAPQRLQVESSKPQ